MACIYCGGPHSANKADECAEMWGRQVRLEREYNNQLDARCAKLESDLAEARRLNEVRWQDVCDMQKAKDAAEAAGDAALRENEALRERLRALDRWCDERRNATDMTTLGMIQGQIRTILAPTPKPTVSVWLSGEGSDAAREGARNLATWGKPGQGMTLLPSDFEQIVTALIEADRRSVLEEAAKACEDAVRALNGAQKRCLYGCAGAEPRVDCVDGNRCECRCHSERRRALLGDA